MQLPQEAKRKSTVFRWWQPEHNGADMDQWTMNDISVQDDGSMNKLEDDLQVWSAHINQTYDQLHGHMVVNLKSLAGGSGGGGPGGQYQDPRL